MDAPIGEIAMQSTAPFHVMTKPTGPICNLDCTYCIYLEKEKLYPNTEHWMMRDDLLETYIRQYIETQPIDVIDFAWQGGEPTLLGVNYFEKVIALQQRYANGKTIQNALQTNGVLLNDEWGEFLARNHFLVGLSIDGPRQLHDFYRVDKGGQPTFDRVMRGLTVLKRHAVEFNTLTVVNSRNAQQPLEVYRFLKEIGSGFMQFIPLVERIASGATVDGLVRIKPADADDDEPVPAAVAEWSVGSSQYGDFLCGIYDYWVRHDVGQQFVQMFDVALQIWAGAGAGLCVFAETCGTAMALEHTGDLYSCDHFVYPDNLLGNIMETPMATLAASAQQVAFGQNKRDLLPRYCRECDVRFACNGECPKHRFLTTPDGEYGLNYLCASYKKFFHHVADSMEFMLNELNAQRPPANVMKWMAGKDLMASDGAKPTRNSPCICGSGKKAKQCCGA
jgi:uncharacterized protein